MDAKKRAKSNNNSCLCHSNAKREEQIKNEVRESFFGKFDCTPIIGNIDFSVAKRRGEDEGQALLFEEDNRDRQFYLWAETKRRDDIHESFVQLILTIGKARTFEEYLPPLYLGAFDIEKIAFIPYNAVSGVFYKNDFNWNIRPSDHTTKEFEELCSLIRDQLENESLVYNYEKDREELKSFIKENFVLGNQEHRKIQVSKANFTNVYLKWLVAVKPTIKVNWEEARKSGILDADFFLADLLSRNNETLKDTLFVLLRSDSYSVVQERCNDLWADETLQIGFKDGQEGHKQFWNKYQRPPRRDFWEHILSRRDLLVPQDVRERQGSYFTPQIWVEKSQAYIASVLGDNWQDEYYVWDCCAGTGNMERGLINKYNVFASTLDKADVDVIKDQIKNGMNLLETHVFQFDFLNDSFKSSKLPGSLREIISDPEKRKKLVIYINPPYAEPTNAKTITSGENKHKAGVSMNETYIRYKDRIGRGIKEVFVQFLMKAYYELRGCWIGQFSTLKHIQADNFREFRAHFKAALHRAFIVPADTFDNVKGKFPIGFYVWNTGVCESIKSFNAEIFDKHGEYRGRKHVYPLPDNGGIGRWIQKYYDKTSERIAYMVRGGADFQHSRIVFITLAPSQGVLKKKITHNITQNNLLANGVYFAVRHCIKPIWLNNRDQCLNPESNSWEADQIFQVNCLVYTLFHNQNTIKSGEGTNHWIPFPEDAVLARDNYKSHFMCNLLKKLSISPEAQCVLEAGRELYRYYHRQSNSNPNASFYDIKEYFQGRNVRGRMNNKSSNAHYCELISNVYKAHAVLCKVIIPKVYEHGFLLK